MFADRRFVVALMLVASVPALASLVGCGSSPAGGAEVVQVTGTITLDGKPLGDAEVFFVPEAGGDGSMGLTDPDGKFDIAAVPPGKYRVRISRQTGDATSDPAFAKKYGKSTPFVAEVSPTKTEFEFDLDP